MDCLIPGHSIRPFCAAIGCLSRIGKDLIFEFDALDGLTLRALSDSKAVFGSFHYEPSFFTKCSSAMMHHRNSNSNSNSNKRRRAGGGEQHHHQQQQRQEEEKEEEVTRWCVRVAMKSLVAVVRPRKDVISLQMSSVGDYLAFEFQIQRAEGMMTTTRITHRVGVTTASSVSAIIEMDTASELVILPSLLYPLLEPLKRSNEMALIINDKHKLISGASFAHGDTLSMTTTTGNNTAGGASGDGPIMMNSNKYGSLKTETNIGFDEVVELHYVSIVPPPPPPLAGSTTTQEQQQGPPSDLKEQVVLVFTTKEFRAVLEFAAKSHFDQELPVTIQFHWGGKPMVVTTTSRGFSAELIMATLDHTLLGSNIRATEFIHDRLIPVFTSPSSIEVTNTLAYIRS